MGDAEGSSTSGAEQAPNAAPQYDQDGYAIDNRPMPPKGSFRYWQRKIWVLLDDPASSTAVREAAALRVPARAAAAPASLLDHGPYRCTSSVGCMQPPDLSAPGA